MNSSLIYGLGWGGGGGLVGCNTQVSFVQNSRDFHALRVSYFAKKYTCFRKLAFQSAKLNKLLQSWLVGQKTLFLQINPLVTKRYIYAAYKKKNLDDLFLKVRQ